MTDLMAKWQGTERRKQKDSWVQLFQWLSLIGWSFFTLALVMSFYAAPEKDFGLTRYRGVETRDYWTSPLTDYLYYLLWLTAIFSFVSIVVSHFRTRRATDNKYYNLSLLLVICVTWVIYIAINAYW
ncbi:hypothetical protein HII17_12435 [Thalassotalea sp. M1531]|uniref:Uncharacterized protein n=1 Tax=Thalassotalea algicola TaxID=2716224 RepID=A0A7Y0LD43_9GAMM|nr:hypothetical protein [Thalassotalea algicola]NMP32370.1 hypothetical protein [Thalassotalea algicola]